MKELNVAIKSAKESGKILMIYFDKTIKINRKSDNSPVTIADRKSERKIASIINKYFPEHNILAEEFRYKQTNSHYKWIIDPLDGTKNFIRGVPFFGNCIALEKNGKIVAGVVNMPAINLFAYASSGNGSFINGKKVKVSNVNQLSDAFLSFGSVNSFLDIHKNQFNTLIKSCYGHRGFGDTLMCLLLAQGHLDIVLDYFLNSWDIAALKIIIEEAGGRVTDFKGNNNIYSGNCIATNGKLHEKVLKIFNKK